MTEKSKNWFYLALMMTTLWGTDTMYEIFFPTKMRDMKFCFLTGNFM